MTSDAPLTMTWRVVSECGAGDVVSVLFVRGADCATMPAMLWVHEERPLRVGDTVTYATQTVRVTKRKEGMDAEHAGAETIFFGEVVRQ